MPINLDPRRLQAFLAVSRERHFSRAAAALHVSQPALSQLVQALERDLHVQLFVRTSRQVTLTPAGEALAAAAPRVLYEAERAAEAARLAATGAHGRLVVASVRSGLGGTVPALLRAFLAAHPDVRLNLYHMNTDAQLQALAERRIDVGVIRAAAPVQGVIIDRLVSEPLVVALPVDHPLTAADRVAPADLAEEDFVIAPRHLGADFFDTVLAYCRAHGFTPRMTAEGDDVDTQLALVAAGVGISLQPAFYAATAPQSVIFRPLDGESPTVDLQLATRADCNPQTRAFAEVALRHGRTPSLGQRSAESAGPDIAKRSPTGPDGTVAE